MTRPRRLAPTAIIVAAASLTMSGCVNLPTSGNVNIKTVSDLPPGNQIGFVPRPPGQDWNTEDVVSGFLAASGAEVGDGGGLNVAEDYLTKRYQKAWHPSSTAPDVIDTAPTINQISSSGRHFSNGQNSPVQVTVSSYHLEVMIGPRLQAYRAHGPYTFTFNLDAVGGQWRIDSISGPGISSNSILLLESSDFQRDYQPRNLYFPASTDGDVLVPYPVYISDSAPKLGVQQLVKSLLKLPQQGSNWLYGSVTTAFPPGTTLNSVQVGENEAVIDLGGKAASVPYQRLQMMRAQIFWTLTHSPYSSTGITSVTLKVGKRSKTMREPDYSNWVPGSPAASGSLFYQVLDQAERPVLERFKAANTFQTANAGATGSRHGARLMSARVQLPALGRGPFTTFAISSTSWFAACRGKTVYVAPLLEGTPALSRELPSAAGACTSLTWDDQGHLFVAAGTEVFEIIAQPPALQLIQVLPVDPQYQEGVTYASMSYSPDGVRVAVIVRGEGGVGAVFVTSVNKQGSQFNSPVKMAQGGQVLPVGADVANPVAVAWLDADHLLVVDRRQAGTQLCEVPLDGGPSVKVPVPRNTVSVTSNGSVVVIGTAATSRGGQPEILASRVGPQGLEGPPQPVGSGGTPAYLG